MNNKKTIRKEINNKLMLITQDSDCFDPKDIAVQILDQHPETLMDYVKEHALSLVESIVKQQLKNASGLDYFEDCNTPKQQVLDFEVSLFTSFREVGSNKAKYIKTDNAKLVHFELAEQCRRKQAEYNTNAADNYLKIIDIVKSTPDLPLGIVLKQLEMNNI